MHSVPLPGTPVKPIRRENCPVCLTGPHRPRVYRWESDGTGYYAFYHCRSCDYYWVTAWCA